MWASTSLASGIGGADLLAAESSYPGLRAEISQADAILRVLVEKSEAVNLPENFDWRKDRAEEFKVRLLVKSSFKGSLAKPGDTLTLHIRYAENRRRYEQELSSVGEDIFADPVAKGEMVVLLRSANDRVDIINALRASDSLIRTYIEISESSQDEAAVKLTQMLNEAMTENYSVGVILNDWKRLRMYLPEQPERFAELRREIYARVLQVIDDRGKRFPSFNLDNLGRAVILATVLDEAQRREVVRALLDLYHRMGERWATIQRNPPKTKADDELGEEVAQALSVQTTLSVLPTAIETVIEAVPENPLHSARNEVDQILRQAEEFIKKQ